LDKGVEVPEINSNLTAWYLLLVLKTIRVKAESTSLLMESVAPRSPALVAPETPTAPV